MAAVGAINIRIGALVGDFLTGMRQASAATKDFSYDLNNKLADSYKNADRESRTFGKGIGRLGSEISSVGRTMSTFVTLPALFAAGQAFRDFANLEKLQKGLDRFGVKLETVREIAKLPGIGLFDGGKAIIGFRAVGIEVEKSKRIVTAFANAIAEAGGSAADLDPALSNIKEFFSTQKIDKVDLKELSARVPQINAALRAAFNTTDTADLNKIGVEKVVEGLLKELEKIPPVAGGAANAMDAFGDTMTVASATMGGTLDKAFDLTGKINGLGAMVEKGANAFSGMSDTGKKVALSIVGIAVAAGPVLYVLGQIIALAPGVGAAIGTGFSAALGPIGLVVVALGLVVYYWDEIATAITKAVVAGNKFFKGVFEAVGYESGVNRINEAMKQNLSYIDKLNGKTIAPKIETNKTASAEIGKLKRMQQQRAALSAQYQGALKNEDSALINSTAKRAKVLDREIADQKKRVASSAAALSEQATDAKKAADAAAKVAAQTAASAGGVAAAVGEVGKAAKEATEEIVALSKAEMELWRIDLASKYYKERDAVKSATEEYKKLVGVVAGLDLKKMSGKTDLDFSKPDKLADSKGNVNTGLTARAGEISDKAGDSPMSKWEMQAKRSADEYATQKDRIIGFNQEVQGSIQNMYMGVATGFGEMIGGVLAGTSGLQELPKMIGGLFGQMLKDIGKAFVATAVSTAKFRVALLANPGLAIAAGVAMIAVGAALQANISKSKTPAFAKGGAAYGTMLATVGDNPNARFDPELIAPASNVEKYISDSIAKHGMGGSDGGEVSFVIRGEQLYGVLNRYEKRKNALG